MPAIRSLRLVPLHATPDDTVRMLVEADDPDGDPLQLYFDWTLAGQPVDSESSELSLASASKGDRLVARVMASDGLAESAWASAELFVANRPPRLLRVDIQPSSQIIAGMQISAEAAGLDPDGDTLEFAYEWRVNNRPVNATGPVLSTVGLKRGDTILMTVRALDGESESELLESPELAISNAPPRIVSQPGESGEDGVFRYRVAVEDPDGDADLEFMLRSAPVGMKIDRESGAITWRPKAGQVGKQPVFVVVNDLYGGRATQSFEVELH